MAEWHTPEFEEIRMDAEINCYSSALHDLGAIGSSRPAEPGAEPPAHLETRAAS